MKDSWVFNAFFFPFHFINGIVYSKNAAVFRLTATDKAVNI